MLFTSTQIIKKKKHYIFGSLDLIAYFGQTKAIVMKTDAKHLVWSKKHKCVLDPGDYWGEYVCNEDYVVLEKTTLKCGEK